MRIMLATVFVCAVFCASLSSPAAAWVVHRRQYQLTANDRRISVVFIPDSPPVRHAMILAWLQTAAAAVTKYYGQFPERRLLVRVKIEPGAGMRFSTTGFEHGRPVINIPIGIDIPEEKLKASWVATHEMTHLAFPMVPRSQRWVAEGQATYIEPLARLQIGDLTAQNVWSDLVAHLPSTLGEDGLDGSRTIARIYWGGALFCLLADVQIRQQTNNEKGFQDAVAAILAAGGNASSNWSVERAFDEGDKAVGGHVLRDLYSRMGTGRIDFDIADLWRKLGVRYADGQVQFDNSAPLAAVRLAIERGHRR